MRLNYSRYILLFAFLLALIGCRKEVDDAVQLRIRIALPNIEQNVGQQRRILGDPGTSELFELPKYIYIFVMRDNGDDTWSIWRRETKKLETANWTRTRYYGANSTREDSVFTYDTDLQFLLNGEHLAGRVYAICSNKILHFNTDFNDISNFTQLMDWKFDSSPDSIQENLQNIYSTPYNYLRGGEYYCTFDCSSGTVFYLDLLLYHVAAKVDIKWNVADTVRLNKDDPSKAVRLTSMKAKNLFNGNAYCFKPMENSSGATPVSSGEEITIVQATDEGLWWEGRSYFYTIPYTTTADGKEDYFPLQMELETNGSGALYRPTIYLEIEKSSAFVPWLRATFNLKEPLTDKEETKIIDN